jgi:putative hemolysin
VGASAAAFGGSSYAVPLAQFLRSRGLVHSAEELSLILVVGLVSFLSLVLGELVPKSLAIRYAEQYALLLGNLLLRLSWVMRPFVWLLTSSSNVVLWIFGQKTSFAESKLSPEELQQLAEEAGRMGLVHARSAEIASRSLRMGEVKVLEIMVPRARIVGLRRQAPPEEIKRILLEEGHSRMPVYEGSIDHVVGYVIAKDLVALALERDLIVLEDVLRPAFFVPELARALDVLQQLQTRQTPMAIVADEQGGVAGLLTLEDLLEELVGEIRDENENPAEGWQWQSDGTALVDGTLAVRDANRGMRLQLPESREWTTVGGLFVAHSAIIPARRERLTLADGTVLEVVDASPRRVRAIRFRDGHEYGCPDSSFGGAHGVCHVLKVSHEPGDHWSQVMGLPNGGGSTLRHVCSIR